MSTVESRHIVYELGDWEISPSTCTIRKLSGAVSSDGANDEVKVTPLSMSVLEYLCERPGAVVSCAEFRENLWRSPVGSDHAVHKAVTELRGALGDRANLPRYIKTIPRRGYCLIAAVTANEPTADSEQTPSSDAYVSGIWKRMHLWRFASVLPVLALLLFWWGNWRDSTEVTSDSEMVSLSVMPFLVQSYSDEDQVLAEGIRESLIYGLSQIDNLQLLSPVSNPSVHESLHDNIANDWHESDHRLHGRVVLSSDWIRVIVQLIRSRDGVNLYSGKFDLQMDDIFKVQDEIASNVVSALKIHLNDDERSRMIDWGTNDALAYEKFISASFHYNQSNPVDFELALDEYFAAIEHDPEFLNAYHGVAVTANRIAFYSDWERAREMSDLVTRMYLEVARLDPNSDILESINTLMLRMQGDNYFQQEAELRQKILAGSPPRFALAHYAMWLIGARMYDEAIQMLDVMEEQEPFKLSPNAEWNYRNLVLPHADALLARMSQLQQRPYHVGFLGSVAINLAFLGDFRKAEVYLAQQESVDISGVISHKSRTIMDFFAGRLQPGSAALENSYRKEPEFNFNNGALSFMVGDMEKGIEYWSNLDPGQLRRLIGVAHTSEYFFPDYVLDSSLYQELLESLGAGKTWQRTLMEGVIAMAPITGVELNPKSQAAYDENRFMVRNNLWSESEWQDLERNRSRLPGFIVD